MQQVEQIIIPRWLIPIDEAESAHEDHALAISDGRIVALGARADIAAKYRARSSVELPTHAVLPGLVNAHTHAAMTLLRGYADDLPLMEWLSEHIWPAEAAWVDADFVEVGSNLAFAEMIRGGTTCFNDMYFFPEVTAACAAKAGIRACIGMIVIDFPTVWAQSADEYIDKGLALRDELRHSQLITTAFAPHAPYTVSDAPLAKIRMLAEEISGESGDCRIHMHIHETAGEIEKSGAQYGMRPLERLARLELLGPGLIAVHMTQLLPDEMIALAEHDVKIAHCPQSNLKLASGMCQVAQLQERGVCVSLGTDGASGNNDLDMLAELQTASLLAKGVSGDPSALPAHAALQAATLGGARALGLEADIGSLAPGKKADLIAIDLAAAATQPVYHAPAQLAYAATRDQVTDVWVGGKRLLEARQLTTLDQEEITRKAAEWGEKIRAGK
ncbi:MAG: TRZ/ATZ family hydrolase [Gammaproteobacteria bacterium]